MLVGPLSLSYPLHCCLFDTKHISFCACFPLTENVGLFERQEGRGLFPESGWSHAVMQVTGKTHCFITDSCSHLFNTCEARRRQLFKYLQECQVAVTLSFVPVFWILMLLRGRTKQRDWGWWRRKGQVCVTVTITCALIISQNHKSEKISAHKYVAKS